MYGEQESAKSSLFAAAAVMKLAQAIPKFDLVHLPPRPTLTRDPAVERSIFMATYQARKDEERRSSSNSYSYSGSEGDAQEDDDDDKKGLMKWLKEEDELLKSLVLEFGTKHWNLIASRLPGRTGKQCR